MKTFQPATNFDAFARQWRGRRVTVMGLGQNRWGSGWSAAAFFARIGAQVTVTDKKPESDLRAAINALKKYRIKYVLGRHRLKDFINADLIIRNPGVPADSPYLIKAVKAGRPVETDISLFFMLCPSSIIGVTGTRGKSTTASLIHHLIKGKWPGSKFGGNIGYSPLNFIGIINKSAPVVLELSSWLLESLDNHRISPSVAVITNIFPDHLDRYRNFEAYQRAKTSICRYQSNNDVVVFNNDQSNAKNIARLSPGHKIAFGITDPKGQGCWLDGQSIYFFDRKRISIIKASELPLVGQHNVRNALAAIAAAVTLGVPVKIIKRRLKTFPGVPERLETIRKWRQLIFIDDTTATSPEATMAALTAIKKPIVLICGGTNKRLRYGQLAKTISRHVNNCILLPGTATNLLIDEFKKINFKSYSRPVASMAAAVQQAMTVAPVGSTILLSPGTASFGLFKNEYDRGRQFRAFVDKLGK